MDNLTRMEEKEYLLPEIYKEFYGRCPMSIPKQLVGTDLLNECPEFNDLTIELLKEDNAEFTLADNDFVYVMHQGDVFCYFKADGNQDPGVIMSMELRVRPENKGPYH